MIYLDNAAGTHPKPERVKQAMIRAIDEFGANPGRGNYALTRKTAAMVEEVREKVAEFFDLPDSSRVIFTSGATMSLNMAIFGMLKQGSSLILSGMEHNAVSRPAVALEDEDLLDIKSLRGDSEGYLRLEQIINACASYPRPSLLALTHASNVCGSLAPLHEIAVIVRRRNIPLLVDAAQSAGLINISMKKTLISLLAIAGHKALYGPPGIGLLLVSEKVAPKPFMHGGTGNRSEERSQPHFFPDRLEAGSVNVPGIAGLAAGLDFVKEVSIEELYNKSMRLTDRLAEMAGNIRGIELYLPRKPRARVPVLALNIRKRNPGEAAALLDSRYGIAIRSGYHCAPAAHRALGTMEEGCLRFSPGWFNTEAEIEKAGMALAELAL
jgi:cysteine desulfurase/selenocysteine lyase